MAPAPRAETPPLHAGEVIECDRQGALRIAECVQVDNDVEHYRRLIEPPMGKPVERLDAADVDALRRAVANAAVGVAAAAAGLGTPDRPLLPMRATGTGLQDSTHCIRQARWHLAQADAQLQLSLFPRA